MDKKFALVYTVIALTASVAYAAESSSDFIRDASIGNQFEISSSRLALQDSGNDAVRSFAQDMIHDHTKAANQLKSVIALSNAELKVPQASLDSKHREILATLKDSSKDGFDKKYVDAQLQAHQEAVSLFRDYSKVGDNQSLKDFARKTLPTLEEHLQHIEKIHESF